MRRSTEKQQAEGKRGDKWTQGAICEERGRSNKSIWMHAAVKVIKVCSTARVVDN